MTLEKRMVFLFILKNCGNNAQRWERKESNSISLINKPVFLYGFFIWIKGQEQKHLFQIES